MENIANTHVADTVAADSATFLSRIESLIKENDFVPDIAITSWAVVVLFGLLALCLFNGRWRRWIFHNLKWIAACVFLVGVMVYMIGFDWEGSRNNLLVLFLRASVSSLEMFVSESDLIEVKHELKDSQFYMTIFSITHFTAVFVSAIFIIRLFGLRLMSMFRLWWNGIWRHGDKLYVFWGVNEKSLTVAESILKARRVLAGKNELEKDEKALLSERSLLVFVKMPVERRHHSSRFTFSHFFHTVDDGIEEYVERIEKLNVEGVKTFITVADKSLDMELVETCNGGDPLKKLGLKNLKRCMRGRHETEFFFLSDDERKNVEAACAMQNLIKNHGRDYNISTIYCHGRDNRINRSVLGYGTEEYNVYLVDSSMLSVWQIKKDKYCQPVNFVELDSVTGTVSSVFTALVIGFGETGRDMLRFLYEFSSFIKETKPGVDGIDDVVEQDKKIYVADKHLGELKTKFLVNAPAIIGDNSIEWLDGMSTHDTLFWDKIRMIINRLNYVVVAVDNDEEAAFITMQLFDFAHRYRRDLSRFKIYVRLRDERNKRLMEQMKKYKTKVNGKETIVVESFGTDKDVFEYLNLRNVRVEKEVTDFEGEYDKISRKISKSVPKDDSKKEDLDEVSEEFKEYYQKEQNRSNVCHVYTKLALAGVADGEDEAKREHMVAVIDRDENNEYPQLVSAVDKALFCNLAYCEHVRWNAKMKLVGFVYGEKSMKRKTHNTLLTCNDLIRSEHPYVRETLRYDKGVVELSLRELITVFSESRE